MNVPGLQLRLGKIVLNIILEKVVTLGKTTCRVESIRAENHQLRLKSETASLLLIQALFPPLCLFPTSRGRSVTHPLPRFFPQPSAALPCDPRPVFSAPLLSRQNPLGYMISAKSGGGMEKIFGSRTAILVRSTPIHCMSHRVSSPKALLLS